jgi:hypothetical protein
MEIDNSPVFHFGNISRENTVATATRALLEVNGTYDPTGDLLPMKIKLGR